MTIKYHIINGKKHYYTTVNGFHIPITSQQIGKWEDHNYMNKSIMVVEEIQIDTVNFGGSTAIYVNEKLESYKKFRNGGYEGLYYDLLDIAKGRLIKDFKLHYVHSEAIFWESKYGIKYGDDNWIPPQLLGLILDNLSKEYEYE